MFEFPILTLRQQRRAAGAGVRDGHQLPPLDEGLNDQDVAEHHGHTSGEDVRRRQGHTAVGNVQDFGRGRLFEQLAAQVRRGALATGGELSGAPPDCCFFSSETSSGNVLTPSEGCTTSTLENEEILLIGTKSFTGS